MTRSDKRLSKKEPKFVTRYQIIDQEGRNVFDPYPYYESAEYMLNNYFKDGMIIEIEIELGEKDDKYSF